MLSYFLSLFNYLFIFVGLGCFDYAITKVVLFRLGLLFGVLLARWFGIWLCFQWCTDSESELEKLKVSFRHL